MDAPDSPPPNPPAGTTILLGKDGPQLIRSTGKRWSDAAETIFLDHLAATCNVTAAAEACGFSARAVYARRRNDPAFAKRWQAALETGYVHIEALLMQRAVEALEGFAPDPAAAAVVGQMTVKEARELLGHHRAAVHGGPRSRRQWARPRSLDEVRDSILRKLAVVAPRPLLVAPAGSFEAGSEPAVKQQFTQSAAAGGGEGTSNLPQVERTLEDPLRPEERGRMAERPEG
jgi:hypothetical protein